MSAERMAELIRAQARACAELGSPFYGALLDRVADDVLADGVTAAVLAGHERDTGPSALALRLAGTVHRMVLSGQAPELALRYPSTGGDGDAVAAWPAFRALLAEHPLEVAAGLADAPQTNEVGRSAALYGALLQVVARDGGEPLPVRLWEIGASGGLNLRADRFRFRAADGSVVGPMSPVELDPAWDVLPTPHRGLLPVIERVGGDPSPVDPRTEDGAMRLASYVWPDQVERLRRLRGAILVAREFPARMVQAGAAELLADLEPAPGAFTVLWHSVMWQYLSDDEQRRVSARLAVIGAAATADAPVAHIAFEPRRLTPGGPHRFLVTATVWPAGDEQILGRAPAHGVPVTWGRPT